jgi:hypothetical protein
VLRVITKTVGLRVYKTRLYLYKTEVNRTIKPKSNHLPNLNILMRSVIVTSQYLLYLCRHHNHAATTKTAQKLRLRHEGYAWRLRGWYRRVEYRCRWNVRGDSLEVSTSLVLGYMPWSPWAAQRHLCTPYPTSHRCSVCLHTLSGVSDASGPLARCPWRLRPAWSMCTPFLASETHLERLHTVSGVPDAFGTLACHSWHPRRVWNTCTPSSVSRNAHTLSPAAQTHLYCLNAIYGVSDASITPTRHSQRLGCVYNTRTPFSVS